VDSVFAQRRAGIGNIEPHTADQDMNSVFSVAKRSVFMRFKDRVCSILHKFQNLAVAVAARKYCLLDPMMFLNKPPSMLIGTQGCLIQSCQEVLHDVWPNARNRYRTIARVGSSSFLRGRRGRSHGRNTWDDLTAPPVTGRSPLP